MHWYYSLWLKYRRFCHTSILRRYFCSSPGGMGAAEDTCHSLLQRLTDDERQKWPNAGYRLTSLWQKAFDVRHCLARRGEVAPLGCRECDGQMFNCTSLHQTNLFPLLNDQQNVSYSKWWSPDTIRCGLYDVRKANQSCICAEDQCCFPKTLCIIDVSLFLLITTSS